MELKKSQDLFSLSKGDIITKRNLFDLIQYSKVESTSYWAGADAMIGNTPQRGINWIGRPPQVQAVIIKTRLGSYKEDGWLDENKTAYRYSFKAVNGKVKYSEKANVVLIQQSQHFYPILLLTERKNEWYFEGAFLVTEIEDRGVVLQRGTGDFAELFAPQDEVNYNEGELKYVTHLLAERSKVVVKILKSTERWVCDICSEDFFAKYGVKYIEAHHKIPISVYS